MYANQFPQPQQQWVYGTQPQPRFTQPLTQEMARMLHQQDDRLSVKISQPDMWRNMCTHKKTDGSGQLALVNNPDGSVTCTVCGETFNLIDEGEKDIENACKKVIDIMQTAKAMFVDIPEEFTKEYFQTMTLISRLPDLYKKAGANFSNYEMYTGSAFPVQAGINTFQQLGNMLTVNPMMGQQNMYNPAMQQAMAYPQPYPQGMGQPQFYQPMPNQQVPQGVAPQQPAGYYPAQGMVPGANPMAYGAPVQPTPAPTGPADVQAPTGEVTQTKQFKV